MSRRSPLRIPVSRPSLGPNELAAVGGVFEGKWLSIGGVTEEFERRLATMLDVPHVLAVNSGSAALHLAIASLVARRGGGEIVVPSLTFCATVQMIAIAGAKPVFCDVEERTLQLDPDDVSRRITPQTIAILPLHYGGYCCDMGRLLDIAVRHGLAVIEDAAHAFGSRCAQGWAGAIGTLGCFSFGPVKNITCGEGGAIVTRDAESASWIRLRRNLGIDSHTWSRLEFERYWDYAVETGGYRYPMPNLNAAIGLEQLNRIDEFRGRRQAIARRYDEAFAGIGAVRLIEKNIGGACAYSYVLRVLDGRRDALVGHLRAQGIGSSVHFHPNHMQPAFAPFRQPLPVTEALFEQILVLPLYFDLTDEEQDEVIAAVVEFFTR